MAATEAMRRMIAGRLLAMGATDNPRRSISDWISFNRPSGAFFGKSFRRSCMSLFHCFFICFPFDVDTS